MYHADYIEIHSYSKAYVNTTWKEHTDQTQNKIRENETQTHKINETKINRTMPKKTVVEANKMDRKQMVVWFNSIKICMRKKAMRYKNKNRLKAKML